MSQSQMPMLPACVASRSRSSAWRSCCSRLVQRRHVGVRAEPLHDPAVGVLQRRDQRVETAGSGRPCRAAERSSRTARRWPANAPSAPAPAAAPAGRARAASPSPASPARVRAGVVVPAVVVPVDRRRRGSAIQASCGMVLASCLSRISLACNACSACSWSVTSSWISITSRTVPCSSVTGCACARTQRARPGMPDLGRVVDERAAASPTRRRTRGAASRLMPLAASCGSVEHVVFVEHVVPEVAVVARRLPQRLPGLVHAQRAPVERQQLHAERRLLEQRAETVVALVGGALVRCCCAGAPVGRSGLQHLGHRRRAQPVARPACPNRAAAAGRAGTRRSRRCRWRR